MFSDILTHDDADRATAVVEALLAHGVRGALTGSLAIGAQLHARGGHSPRRPLNDIDLVVPDVAAIPESVADAFLLHHVHPFAPAGKILVQLIHPQRAVRVDLFRTVGGTLLRSRPLCGDTSPLDVVALEDLVARTTAYVYGRLSTRRAVEAKHAQSLDALSRVCDGLLLDEAWRDHRGEILASFPEALRAARRLLARDPELVTNGGYSAVVTPCPRCEDFGRFRRADPERIVGILGYW